MGCIFLENRRYKNDWMNFWWLSRVLLGPGRSWKEAAGGSAALKLYLLKGLNTPALTSRCALAAFFRDAFPNLVNLLDDTMNRIANLDEPPEMNYLAKHVKTETAEKMAQGIDAVQALEEAGYRIFGCRSGAYGVGVCDVIDSKNWKDEKTWERYTFYGAATPTVKRITG